MRCRGAAVLAVVMSLAGAGPLMAQVSPGPLSRPHAQLDTALKCLQCHGSARESMDGKCLACHTDIGWLRDHKRGFHGKTAEPCAQCHPDHAGLDFDLIQWPDGSAEKFDHARAGFTLAGKHHALACGKCHQQAYVSADLRDLGRHNDPGRRWTGLDPQCASCHQDDDAHRGALGPACATCHGQQAWRPAAAFDHAKTSYPLTGRHATVACASCHEAASLKRPVDSGGRTIPLYRPLPHQECSSCHTDPHQARLGASCARCHATSGFQQVTANAFNHELTRYPLRGRHGRVPCASCHDPKTAWGKRPAFITCGGCHADAHAGQATLGGRRVDCASCHDVGGWKPSTFGAPQHAATRYPLEGKHAGVACAECHAGRRAGTAGPSLGRAGVWMRPVHGRCADCHADAHRGQLVSRLDKGSCESCHDVHRFKPSTFTRADHAAAGWPLAGRHADTPCASCHGPQRAGLPPLPGEKVLGSARVALTMVETGCGHCHLDPHGSRFTVKGRVVPACRDCHDERAFSPSVIDVARHQTFSFRLEGAHRAVPCIACHEELAPRAATVKASTLRLAQRPSRRLEFPASRSRCQDCHAVANVHGNQFDARADRGACSSCHTQDTFRSAAAFDHDRDAAFSLKGAHARVACRQCHVARPDPSGRLRVVYRPVPTRCEDCHRGTRPAARPSPSASREIHP